MRKLTQLDLLGESKPSGNQLNYQVCPVCHNDNWHFYMNPVTGGWDCKVCGAKGFVEGRPKVQRVVQRHTIPFKGWTEIHLPEFEPLSDAATKYLRQRNIAVQEIHDLALVEWTGRQRILIPYFDDAGQIIYYNSRDYTGEQTPKYMTAPGRHPLYMPSVMPTPYNHAVIVEGPFDAIRVAQAGFRAIALGGRSLPRHLESDLKDAVRLTAMVHICFDGDAWQPAIKLFNRIRFRMHNTVVVKCCPDNQDPGDMPLSKLRELLL